MRPHRGQLAIPLAGDAGGRLLLLYRHVSDEAVTGVTAPRGMADSAAAWNIWRLVCCNTRLLWEGQRSVVSAYRRCATDRCRKHTGTTKKKRIPRYNPKKERGKMSLTGTRSLEPPQYRAEQHRVLSIEEYGIAALHHRL